jgi:hypothetical protein
MGIIEIEEMEFYAYHGHYEEERVVGNRFLLDLKLKPIVIKLLNRTGFMMHSTTRLLTKLFGNKCRKNRTCLKILPNEYLMHFTKTSKASKKQP